MNYQRTTERGQALILIALAAIGLFAFSALAIDGSRSYSNKRHAQNAADTSVLAAALASIRCTTGTPPVACNDTLKLQAARDAALERATSNGFTTGALHGNTVVVEVNLCSEAGITCKGLSPTATAAEKAEYIRVRITTTIPATFGRVLGRPTFTSAVEAIARVQGKSTAGSGTAFAGAAMVSTKRGNYDQCFLFNGTATLETHDSGVFVNCSGQAAFYQNGSTTFTMGADSYVVGKPKCVGGNNGTITGGTMHCGADEIVVDKDTYAGIATMPKPIPTCSTNGTYPNGNHLTPGNHSNLTVNKDTVMDPGVYCVSGSFNVNGQNKLSGTGTVTIVMQNADFNVGSSSVYTFDSLEIYTVNTDFKMQGTLTTTPNTGHLRFYSSGTGNSIINSGSILKSDDAYFYLHRGAIRWNGGTNVQLKAPTSGPYNGILIHTPWENTSASILNGGSHTLLYGTFLMPQSNVTFNGGTFFELHSQIIASTYILDGNGTVDIYYLASPLITPPTTAIPTIKLSE